MTTLVAGDLNVPATEVPDAVLEKIKNVSVTTIAGALSQLGVTQTYMQGVVPRTSRQNFAGTAMTLHTLPTREDVAKAQQGRPSPHRASFATIGRNQVLVIEARGEMGTGVLGDIFAASILARGGVALVTDGCTRDMPAMEEVGLPVYTGGMHGSGFGARHLAVALNVPIACAGVLVMPGDVIVGDPSGVIVVPSALAAQVADAGTETDLRDSYSRMKVLEGVPVTEVFPLNQHWLAQYQEWKSRQ